MSSIEKIDIIIGVILLILLFTGGVFLAISEKEDKIPSTITNCTFTTGTIAAKRQYCTQDCRYTLVITYDDKATEVDVPKEKYEFGIVGGSIEILTNCK